MASLNGEGFIKLGGTVYTIPKASTNDVLTIVNYLKKSIPPPMTALNEVMQSEGWQALPEETKQQLSVELAREAAQKQLGGKSVLDGGADGEIDVDITFSMLQQPEHCAYFAWVLIRKKQPTTTLEEIQGKIDELNAPGILLELVQESGLKELAAQNTVG